MRARHIAIALPLGVAVAALAPRGATAQIRAPLPRPRVAPGSAPSSVAAAARDAFAVTVSWELVPWANSQAIERASSPAGPWRRVGVYAPPAPAGTPSAGDTPAQAAATPGNRIATAAPAPAIANVPRRDLSALVRVRVSYVDTSGLAPATSYSYRVVASYADSGAGISQAVQVSTSAPPPVVDLGAAGERSQIGVRLTWNDAAGVTSHVAAYRVYKNGTFVESPTYTPVLGQPALPLPLYSDFSPGMMAGQSASYDVEPVYRLPGGGTISGPRVAITGTATKTREWCPSPRLVVKLQSTAKPGGFDLLVTALDRGSQHPLAGTVSVTSGANTDTPRQVSGAIGQPLFVATCMRKLSAVNTTEAVAACPGRVTVPGYPAVDFSITAGVTYTK